MIGIATRRAPAAVLQETLDHIASLGSRCRQVGLSPHAPYTTVPELLRLSAQCSRRRRWRLAVHVAESALEFDMFTYRRGEMFDWMQRSSRDMSDCGKVSPVRHLERCGVLSENLLAVHVNYLGKGDAALLARRKAHVVHCPRSHAFFGHGPFPLRELRRAGVNVCLGTDSLASVLKRRRETVELNLFEEMRCLAEREAWLSPREILRMVTINGASALGLGGKVGELRAGAKADLIAVPFAGKAARLYETVLHHLGPLGAVMIDGRWEGTAGVFQSPSPSGPT
jgi:cytosine/adenosine deaminase-related metal-dependent hydrolase